MTKNELIKKSADFMENTEFNYISKEAALNESLIGQKIYDSPIFCFGDPNDILYETFKDPKILGEHFIMPMEWLSDAKTVISFFLPFQHDIKEQNKQRMDWPSESWVHGRWEGQIVLNELTLYIDKLLKNEGCTSVIPNLDKRADFSEDESHIRLSSKWSERHTAYVCGLGTFGLSRGLITDKGIAGRFGSLITNAEFVFDKRNYSEIYEYCSSCGLCIKNCPANAISFETGKNHFICYDFLCETKKVYAPSYGCGKCQVAVPCENGIPM